MVTRISSSLRGKNSRIFLEVFMEIVLEIAMYFILTFALVYLISYLLLVRKKDQYNEAKIPVEVEYMVKKYHLDMKKIDYRKFLNAISLVGSLDMSIAVIVILGIENIVLQLLAGFLILIPLILISFRILGKYYVKKGYVKNERKSKRKQNRK